VAVDAGQAHDRLAVEPLVRVGDQGVEDEAGGGVSFRWLVVSGQLTEGRLG
jgi:hypothetical protein